MLPDIIEYLKFWKIRIFNGSRFSINDIDKKLGSYLSYDGGYYVELGANNGFSQSNTAFLNFRRNWRGVLIEPSLSNFLKCLFYRKKGNTCFCAACVPFDFDSRFVEIDYGNLMSLAPTLVRDIDDATAHIQTSRQFEGVALPTSVKFGAVARTLTDCLLEANAPPLIDFLSLDVEGAELSVLQGVDFERFKFKFILVEARNFLAISEYLENFGYKFEAKMSHHDYFFKLEELKSM